MPWRLRALDAAKRVPWALALIAAVVAAQLYVLWSNRFFPSQDGPAHLETARALRQLLLHQSGIVREFYAVNPHADPNWLIHVLLALLTSAVAPLVAEKLLLSLYLVGLPVAAVYAARAIEPEAGVLAAVTLPLLLSFPVHMGFYNFSLSLVLLLLTLGFWLRHRQASRIRDTAILAALLTLVYFGHIVSFGIAGLVIVVVGACDMRMAWRALGADNRPARLQGLRRQVSRLGLAFAPGLLLTLGFLIRNGGELPIWRREETLLRRLLEFRTLVSFDRREVPLAATYLWLLLAVVLGLAWRKVRQRDWNPLDGLLLCAAGVVGLYFALPAGLAGGGYVNSRVALVLPLVLMLWLATVPAAARLRTLIAVGSAALALAFLLIHAGSYARLTGQLEEYFQVAPHLRPGSTVLSLSFREEGARGKLNKVHPFAHAAGYLAAGAELVDLGNYEADQRYFPVVYRPEVDPRRFLGGNPEPRHSVGNLSLQRYEAATGKRVDYVILWDLQALVSRRPAQRRLLRELRASYDLVFTSSPGRLQLYRRRP